ncbi:uncharacterized protein SPAPADRAFT_149411 [Spathaspora passalidarum NRRL Y-27907]|uniref:RRM domain-containing protein n=1 Tax=Spathaspora passalidarum (strain NRRL Y-27907 / 11-Y1) TaxID=619300 RepID=G3AIR0_SPAPN|nr:uncharacterized protein SPAPADRAFT_149411 [Spathaspora passalidarum NRRL Y-27907]EGW34476.1 hypothetical protein SPAPADRAFT_149411 [Spathaspora passalidarum NRRL Y-27907]
MDFRNLSPAPNQMDSVMQRRPSLSSLSSTSGYGSSTYGGGGTGGVGTGVAVPPGSGGNGTTVSNPPNSRNGNNLHSSWLNQSISTSTVTPTNVGPWVEQQQQQQQSTLESLEGSAQAVLGIPPKGLGNRSLSSASSTKNDEHNTISSPNMINNVHSPNNEPVNDNLNANISMTNEHDGADDDLIPTAIVIKNIPFAIKKEQLLDVMTKLNLPLPYAFNYHFDNGVFRGLAFANFTSTDETSLVVNQLNGREIGGRKLRVEYKKMLPLQERERIEREKREKRGQLEEQHRSTSNASLASLMSAASTTAATKNLSINGATPSGTTERLFVNLPFATISAAPPMDLNFNDPEILELYTQLVLYRDDVTKSIYELAISPATLNINQRKNLSLISNYLNLLELFDNGLIIIRRKPGYIAQSIIQQASLGAQQPPAVPPHSSSMMNLSQLAATMATPSHPELLRSQSQSALQLPRLRQQASTPVQQTFPQYGSQQQQQQQQPLPPQQQQQQQQQQQHQQQQPQQQRPYAQNQPFNIYHQQQPQQVQYQQQVPQAQVVTPTVGSSSAAALLRSSSNRSYVDVRATPPLNNNFIHQQPSSSVTNSPNTLHNQVQYQHSHQQQQQQPPYYQGTNAQQQHHQQQQGGADLGSRFQPFGQHTHLTGSFTSLSQSTSLQGISGANANASGQLDEYGNDLTSKFNTLALGGNPGVENLNSGGIWGPK